MKPIIDNPFNIKSISIMSIMDLTGVSLRKAGSVYQARCPLHNDKDTPSLTVYPATNSWCCFGAGCGGRVGKRNGGDVIEWVMQRKEFSYREALDWLKSQFSTLPPVKIEKPTPKTQRIVPPDLVVYWHNLLDKCDKREWFHGRGFTSDTIDCQMFGYDGKRVVIPVWENEPGNSKCLGVRLRLINGSRGSKYKGLKNYNRPTIWGKWHCEGSNLVLGFAGELDACRAVQDKLPGFSLVNGVNAWMDFPEDWPDIWFPDASFMLGCFDKKEESDAGRFAHSWSDSKGFLTGRVFHYPPSFNGKDYCDWRDTGHSAQEFMDLVIGQLRIQ